MPRIVLPPTREEFKRRVRTFCSKAWVGRLMNAWDVCEEVHIQKRQDGSRYCDHPRAAAWILIQEIGVLDPWIIILELLHDTGEEKEGVPLTYEDVEQRFGVSRLADGHRAITKLEGQEPSEYTRQVFAGGIKVIIAKFGDRLHNMRTLGACPLDKQDRIIVDTWMYYYPYNMEYTRFLHSASKREREIIDLLWELIIEAIDELLAARKR